MKLIDLKSASKCNSFDVTIGIKVPFFLVSVTIEPGRSLLQFVTTNCLIKRTTELNELILTMNYLHNLLPLNRGLHEGEGGAVIPRDTVI